MSKLIKADFHGDIMQFRNDGWFNATVAAAKFGREPYDWLRQRENVEYTIALADIDGNSGFVEELNKINELSSRSATSQAKLLKLIKKTGLVKTKVGAPENGGELRADSRTFAPKMDLRHRQLMDNIRKYQSKFEELGLLPFEKEARPEGQHGGGDVVYALLNEDQAYFLLTLSRFFQKSEGFRLKREPFSPPSAGFCFRFYLLYFVLPRRYFSISPVVHAPVTERGLGRLACTTGDFFLG